MGDLLQPVGNGPHDNIAAQPWRVGALGRIGITRGKTTPGADMKIYTFSLVPVVFNYAVVNPLAGDLALELGEGQQHVEGQPPHAGGRVEGLGHRDEVDAVVWLSGSGGP